MGNTDIAHENTAESVLTQIWCDVLRLDSIARTDDFFEIGGDSLKMLEMLYLVNEQLGVDLPPGVLFDAATIETLAEVIENCGGAS